MSTSIVRDYYTTQVLKEWRRLVRDAYHRLELETTLHFLEQYLPKTGRILDAGSGPGRYTLELARRGLHPQRPGSDPGQPCICAKAGQTSRFGYQCS